jgi:hypothetical protein
LPPGAESSSSRAGAFALVELSGVQIERRVSVSVDGKAVEVSDGCRRNGDAGVQRFTVRWQFAPRTLLENIGERRFRVTRGAAKLEIEISRDWANVMAVASRPEPASGQATALDPNHAFDGVVSASFRRTDWAPFLELAARPEPGSSARFQTRFLLTD